ncbi:DUF3769 domain-containing protein [Waterburya agarophytonicola]|uniref:DUF3769 domain-containing protein n=1 Tax=Waterburya agarophytonicola TaxID=2886916 RepID=UPI001E3FE59E|nr:DUF3769 domain-containing protein [Waterburya agarophytonicola]
MSQLPLKAWSLPQTSSLDSTIKIQFPKYLIAQERGKARQEFTISDLETEFQPSIPIDRIEVIEVIADSQEYNRVQQVITAKGNVVLRFAESVMTSDRLEINLKDRIAVAKGNVTLKRGDQVLRGNKFEYYLVADRGVIFNAGGEIYQPSLAEDIDGERELTPEKTILDRALSDRLKVEQPISDVTATRGFSTSIGSSRDINLIGGDDATGGTVNRLRFEAERIDFEGSEWEAVNLSLTNDPFSPPELEIRADRANFIRLNSLENKLTTSKSRLVLDDKLSVPLLLSTFAFDNRPSNPGLFNLAFDGEERGGFLIERSWTIVDNSRFNWKVTPQYFVQRALSPTTFEFSESDEGGVFNPGVFGLKNRLNINIAPRTRLNNNFSLTSFDINNLEDNFRGKVALQQTVGKLDNPYRFALEYNYRDRLFNGSLGFQTVRNSIGGVVTSPNMEIANTGITFNYQASIQNINADTDRQDLLEVERQSDRINLSRYQGALFMEKNFAISRGTPLPSTKEEGLRYSPTPVVPYLELLTGIRGVASFYSNGEQQPSLEGTIGFQGQLGHFSRSWLDYTGFKFSYSQNLRGDESPFLFDRLVDRQTLDLGINQQLYGPIRLGVSTSLDLNSNNEISTDYTIEYSRRTHNITLRYNPVLELGSFSLRISDFNWQGNPQPFRDEITPVIQGVER